MNKTKISFAFMTALLAPAAFALPSAVLPACFVMDAADPAARFYVVANDGNGNPAAAITREGAPVRVYEYQVNQDGAPMEFSFKAGLTGMASIPSYNELQWVTAGTVTGEGGATGAVMTLRLDTEYGAWYATRSTAYGEVTQHNLTKVPCGRPAI